MLINMLVSSMYILLISLFFHKNSLAFSHKDVASVTSLFPASNRSALCQCHEKCVLLSCHGDRPLGPRHGVAVFARARGVEDWSGGVGGDWLHGELAQWAVVYHMTVCVCVCE